LTKINPQIILTKDGSPTLLDPVHHSSYHSIHGAIQESRHVFISAGLSYVLAESAKSHISIFEMGLGTGLNALLSLTYISPNKNLSIDYTSIELHPLAESCWTLLDYNAAGDPKYFEAIHKTPWHLVNRISPNFTLEKKLLDITEYIPGIDQVDLIYYDAFGPGIQPALWTTATLKKMVDMLVTGGVFVTYCAKGEVRRTLSRLGLLMERLPGPPGKREMLRGIKII
jgi:tRNA U34 5-methylaminomethyl-2-thiouridine-forming methyltransferase MnmC